jgi:two-component system CheB/CheR fusion protein
MRKKKIISVGNQKKYFPIVGIGGSAGGLEAFQELLKNTSSNPGMALVFIMHLAPDHKSLLPELLARLTKMPVQEVKNGMLLEVNHVYIKPPSANLSISRGKLILNARKDIDFRHMSIDYFFRSLAE